MRFFLFATLIFLRKLVRPKFLIQTYAESSEGTFCRWIDYNHLW
jgi:hypothetical protein